MKYRLGRSIARMEAAMSTPDMFGRVANAQTMRDVSLDLMDIQGAVATLPGRCAWRRRRRGSGVRLPAGGADGHLRRHPRGLPQHDRPARTGTRAAELLTTRQEADLAARLHTGSLIDTANNPQCNFALESGDHLRGEQLEGLVGAAVMGEQHNLAEAELLQLVQAIDDRRGSADQPALVQPESRYTETFLGELRGSAVANRHPARAP